MEGTWIELDESIDDRLLEASRLAEEGEDGRALELLLALEADHAENPTLLCMIGVLAAHAGAEGMAGDYFRRCLALGPMEPELLVRAGAGLAALDDPQAEPALRAAALMAPELPAARMHYGSYLVRSGLIAQGLEELTAARSLQPEDAGIRRGLGVGYLLTGRSSEALDELEEAVSLDPEDSELRLLYGLALLQERNLERAGEELHPLGEALAASGEVQSILSLLFALVGWEEEAWIAFSRAEEAADPIDRAMLAEVEEALSGGEEAVGSLLLDELAPTALRDRLYRA